MSGDERTTSFAQETSPSALDRLGRALSTRRIRRLSGPVRGVRAADIGCGFDAALGRSLFVDAAELTLVDVKVDADLDEPPRVRVLEGTLPGVLEAIPSSSFDVIICNNVIEHLWEPVATLRELYRLTAPRGRCVVNVPTWRGKIFLEFAAFRLGLAPREEMDDHKWYFDPRDLWPLLVQAGFSPSDISCRRHKAGLNTIALCRKPV